MGAEEHQLPGKQRSRMGVMCTYVEGNESLDFPSSFSLLILLLT